jgi:hypothetical protein
LIPNPPNSGFRRRPTVPTIITYTGRPGPGCSCFPRHCRGPWVDLGRDGGRRISPRAVEGVQRHRRSGESKWRSPRVGRLQACNPRAGLIGPPDEEIPGALQDVSYRPQSLHREFFNLPCLLNSTLSSRRYADTSVLSLTPVTPRFKGKPECKNTCAPGSSFTHVLTQ